MLQSESACSGLPDVCGASTGIVPSKSVGYGTDLGVLLIAAGVPARNVVRIITGQYTPWDDQTIALDRLLPGKGVAAKAFLEPAYNYPLHQPTARHVAYSGLLARAFVVPSNPLDQSYALRIVSGSEAHGMRDQMVWLDDRLASVQKQGSPLSDALPWGPAEDEMSRTERYEFRAYAGRITRELRLRLWASFGNTLRMLWVLQSGAGTNRLVASAAVVRDLWLMPGALPIGFIDRTFVFLGIK